MTEDEAAWTWGEDLVGLRVYDVNGKRMGRVAAVEMGALDVDLRKGGRLRVPLADVIDADDHDVTLRDEARYLARPELRPTLGD